MAGNRDKLGRRAPADEPSDRALATLVEKRRQTALLITGILGGGGGLLGLMSFSVTGVIIETVLLPPIGEPGGPRFTYGQQAALFAAPPCALLGTAMGLALGLFWFGRPLLAFLLLTFTSLGASALVRGLWLRQRGEIGPDPSEYILYWPPMLMSFVAGLLLVVLVLIHLIMRLSGRKLPARAL